MNKKKSAHFNRIAWQCRRGMLELDQVLIPFVQTKYALLDEKEKMNFERLLTYSDPELYCWLIEGKKPQELELVGIIAQIVHYAKTTI